MWNTLRKLNGFVSISISPLIFNNVCPQNSPENSILYNERSDFQEIMVFQSAQYGRVLVIDGILRKLKSESPSHGS